MEQKSVIVSVCMITYNHENFIREAIEGVLMQKTDFPIELIIGEDCSTDNTRSIVLEYASKYPEIIRPLLPEKNLGVMKNFIETLLAAIGKYIALCEGDDYWTDPYKLQKQVDFLEANEAYSFIHTNGQDLLKNKLKIWSKWKNGIVEGDVTTEIYYSTIARTCSVLFRTVYLPEYLIISKNCKSKTIGDWPLFAFYASKGKFGYLTEPTCVYRHSANSTTRTKNKMHLTQYYIDSIEIKRFLRDYLFKGKLYEEFSEEKLIMDTNYLKLKYAFDVFDYNYALEISKENLLNSKSLKLLKFTNNKFLFMIGSVYRKAVRLVKF